MQLLFTDAGPAKRAAQIYGIKVEVVDMAGLTQRQMKQHLSKDGAHFIACCFGIADAVVMDVLELTDVTVFRRHVTP